MKNSAKVLAVLSVLFFTTVSTIPLTQAVNEGNIWAVIVCGSTDFRGDAGLLYEVLRASYLSDENIYFLYPEPTCEKVIFNYPDITPVVDAIATKDNARWAFTHWLAERSTENDLVFIYVMAHGGGYFAQSQSLEGGRVEFNGDEGNETRESTIWNPNTNSTGWDLNNDNDTTDWFGVDECFEFQVPTPENETLYYDDEVKDDLSTVQCRTMVFVLTSCTHARDIDEDGIVTWMDVQNSEPHCYSGGFIDDLSVPNRIIITMSNETSPGFFDLMFPGHTTWGLYFILCFEPLYQEDHSHDDPDTNGDGRVSVKEAFDFATEHDPWKEPRWAEGIFFNVTETPWMDDNGNGLPTYINETDVLDPTDGQLASETFLYPEKSHNLTVLAEGCSPLTAPVVYIDGEYAGYTNSTFIAKQGNHTVSVRDFWDANLTGCPPGYRYRYNFTRWENNSTENPRNIIIVGDTTITAYFNRTLWIMGDVDGNCKVDGSDTLAVTSSFLSRPGDANWNPEADVNASGKVDGTDLLIVAANFLRHC